MNDLTKIVIVAAVLFLGIVGFAYSGFYNVSASLPHSGLSNWLLSTTADASVERHARSIEVPRLDDEALLFSGINDFDSMCTGCHGSPGMEPEAIGQGLNPPAPDLTSEAADMTPAELFWVTKNGIRMTGMPAWGATHSDDEIWPVVAFMKKLPELDAAGYQQMLASAAGHGHHAEDASGEEHSHDEAAELPEREIHVHPDGSEHLHEVTVEPEAVPEHSTHEHNDD